VALFAHDGAGRNRRFAARARHQTRLDSSSHLQVDETPIAYLEPGQGKNKQGHLWTGSRPGSDGFFRWKTAGHRVPAQCYPVDFQGTVQCDGYAAYPAFVKERAGAIELDRLKQKDAAALATASFAN